MGACQTGGTVIDWVMRPGGVSFRHAVELLRAGEPRRRDRARRSGRRPSAPPPPRSSTDAEDAEALAQVVAYYHATLPSPPRPWPTWPGARSTTPRHRAVPARLRQPHPRAAAPRPRTARPGREIRGRLQRLGVYRDSGHEHLAGSSSSRSIDPTGTSPNSTAARSRPTCDRARRCTSTCPARTAGSGTTRGSSVAR